MIHPILKHPDPIGREASRRCGCHGANPRAADGMLVVQHQLDHLDGILILDHA